MSFGQIILSILAGKALKYLWNQIYIVQFIVYFMTWNIIMPAKVLLLLEVLKDLVFFAVVKKAIKQFTSNDACKDVKEICEANEGVASSINRINSDSLFENAGVIILGFSLVLAFMIVGVCYVIGKYSPKVKAIYRKIKGKMMWNYVVRYFF